MRIIFTIVLFLCLSFFSSSSSSFATDMFSVSMSDESPASFFASGINAYYIDNEGMITLSYNNDHLDYKFSGKRETKELHGISSAFSNMLGKINDFVMLLQKDGSVKLLKTNDDYSCIHNELLNCLYSDVVINSIDVENIVGKTQIASVGLDIPAIGSKEVTFRLGAKLYIFNMVFSAFNFDNFNAFDSLICSKDIDTGSCRNVIRERSVDKAALFELYQANPNIENTMFTKEMDKDFVYGYVSESLELKPYSLSCVEKLQTEESLPSCVINKAAQGNISEKHHQSGIIYWVLDFNNPNIKNNEIFWVNNEGEPFKAFVNKEYSIKFKMFNKTAAETVNKAF